VLLLGGCALATVGLYGLIVKPDIFDQLHVAGLITGPGVILVLAASIGTGSAEIVTSAVLVIAFVLVTASISTHVIAQAGLRRYVPAAEGQAGDDGVRRVPADGSGSVVAGTASQEEGSWRVAGGMRVLVALDGSPSAQVAADLAADLEWPPGTVIRLVEAVEPGGVLPVDSWSPAHDGVPNPGRDAASGSSGASAASAASGAGLGLEAAAAAMERPGIRIETALLRGDAADLIADEAESFGADLVITGRGRGGFEQSLLGWSGGGETLGGVTVPVLVARSRALRAVLLATDGSAQSAAATDIVVRWPIFDHARIHVVLVSGASPPGNGGSPSDADQRTVEAAAAWLADAGRDVVTEIVQGQPGAAIVEAAERRSADLIVIGTRGRTGLGRALLGSVAGDVLEGSECSVLIVGPARRRPAALRNPLSPS
jgi:monovalent cation/proton antiporter MnhG/PhaG subunit